MWVVAEKAWCVLWTAEGLGFAAIQGKFRKKYRKSAKAHFSNRRGYEDNQSSDGHPRMGGAGSQQFSKGKKGMIRSIFIEDPRTVSRIEATQAGLHPAAIWNFLKQELKLHGYALQMHQEIRGLTKQNRI